MKYPKGPVKPGKSLTYIWIFTALLFVLAGGLYLDYDRNRDSRTSAEFAGQSGEEAQSEGGLPNWVEVHGEMPPGQYFTLNDEKGEPVQWTSIIVHQGDEFITANNRRFEVTTVDYTNLTAACRFIGVEEMAYYTAWDEAPVASLFGKEDDATKIGVYMTHNDESYVPTDGTESIDGRGGIMEVGDTFGATLEQTGHQVTVSDNHHDPHDANAYHRSRKTAVQLLKENPDVLFDVHRDGIEDPGYYETEINGEKVTGIRLVVGKQNPHMETNLTFAKEIKAYMDKHYPGLIKDIYMGKGNYNQDLGPRVMLLEVGTHTNSREEAEAGAQVFAKGVGEYLQASIGSGVGAAAKTQGKETTAVERKSGSSAAIIAGVAVVLGVVFILVSRGPSRGRS
ncbi:MAG: stage II sporulation protein P [Clostridiales bacterium]